jgi:hypothetical protein
MVIMKRGCKYYDAFWKWEDDYVDIGSRIMIMLEWVSQEMVIFVRVGSEEKVVIIRMTAGNGKIMMTVMICKEEYKL